MTTTSTISLEIVLGAEASPRVAVYGNANTGPIATVSLPTRGLDIGISGSSIDTLLDVAEAFKEAARRLQAAQIADTQPEHIVSVEANGDRFDVVERMGSHVKVCSSHDSEHQAQIFAYSTAKVYGAKAVLA